MAEVEVEVEPEVVAADLRILILIHFWGVARNYILGTSIMYYL